MKTLFIVATSLLLICSCTKSPVKQVETPAKQAETPAKQTDPFKAENFISNSNDKSGSSSQQIVYSNSFTYSVEALKLLADNPATDHFRVALEINEEPLMNFPFIAITSNNVELGQVEGNYEDRDISLDQLHLIADVSATEMRAQSQVISEHILQPSMALTWIGAWNDLLNSGDPLGDFTSYNGNNIQYFIIEKDVVEELLSNEQTDIIVVTFALNGDNKLTPILINVDYVDAQLNTSTDNIYLLDYSHPCPPMCAN